MNMEKRQKSAFYKIVLAGVLGLTCLPASAINIQFDYRFDSNNFFNTQAKKDVLNTAGSYFDNIIGDKLTAISSSGFNHFNTNFYNPDTGVSQTINDFSVTANTLTIFVGGQALTGSTLGQGGPGGFNVSGTSSFINNAISRGQSAPTQGTTAADFAPWGGSISFNSAVNWYFDPDVTTSADVVNNDFYSVALHELGHVLGIGAADSWNNQISGNAFTGATSIAAYGGSVPLNTALDHWASGTMSTVNGVAQEAAMTPSITLGTRKVFTKLDNAGLSDVGWQVSTVPIPAAIWLFGSGLLGLVGVAKRSA